MDNIKSAFGIDYPVSLHDLLNNIPSLGGDKDFVPSVPSMPFSYGTVTATGVTYSSTTDATTEIITVEHNLNSIPSYIMFFKLGISNGTKTNTSVSSGTSGYYRSYTEVLSGYRSVPDNKSISSYLSYGTYLNSSSKYTSVVRGGYRYFALDSESIITSYEITNVTDVSFDLPKNLSNGASYFWLAF
jgi:hypothetical protein